MYVLRNKSFVLAVCCLGALACAPRHAPENQRVVRHQIAPDETLEDVAKTYYGNERRARDIRRFNELGDDPPVAGTELRIPLDPDELAAYQERRAARVPYNEGLAMVERGDFVDAAREFRRAIELDPGFADAHFNLGVTYQRMKAFEKALESYRLAADIEPDNADYQNATGSAYFHLGRYDRAVSAFRKALAANPTHLRAQFSLAAALEKKGDLEEARAAWRRYLELDADSDWGNQARLRLEALVP